MIYERFFRSAIFPFYEGAVRRRSTYRHYREMAGIPFRSPDELAAMREDLLSRLVRHAGEHVPYYGEVFARHGLDWRDVRDIAVLRDHGIIMTKDDLRARCDDLLSRAYSRDRLASYATSGSTGDPIVVYMTNDLHCYRDAGKYRVEDWVGKHPGARSTIIWGRLQYGGRLKRLKAEMYWKLRNYQFLSAFDISDTTLLGYLEAIRHHRSRFLESYVSVIVELARVIEEHGAPPPPLEGILTGAEALYDFQRERIERAFRCPVYNRYGSSEFKSIAAECTERRGMHINADSVIVEVIGPDGEPVVGEPGDILVTDLRNLAMPLIRYRIGDIGIMSAEACPCGRNFPMLSQVIGRENELLRLPDGTTMTGQYIAFRLVRIEGVRRYRAIQKSLTRLHLLVVEDGTATREGIAGWIRNTYAELVERGMEVTVEFVDDIPRTKEGKHLFFTSEIDGKGGRT